MNVEDLIQFLAEYGDHVPVMVSSPVEGDCENVVKLTKEHLYYDPIIRALVIL